MNFYRLCFTVLTLFGGMVTAEAHGRRVTLERNVHRGECESTAPLATYERCSNNSSIGLEARACAEADAMNRCRSTDEQYNVDCHVVTSWVQVVASQEFPGYRKCIAIAKAHGYERN